MSFCLLCKNLTQNEYELQLNNTKRMFLMLHEMMFYGRYRNGVKNGPHGFVILQEKSRENDWKYETRESKMGNDIIKQ